MFKNIVIALIILCLCRVLDFLILYQMLMIFYYQRSFFSFIMIFFFIYLMRTIHDKNCFAANQNLNSIFRSCKEDLSKLLGIPELCSNFLDIFEFFGFKSSYGNYISSLNKHYQSVLTEGCSINFDLKKLRKYTLLRPNDISNPNFVSSKKNMRVFNEIFLKKLRDCGKGRIKAFPIDTTEKLMKEKFQDVTSGLKKTVYLILMNSLDPIEVSQKINKIIKTFDETIVANSLIIECSLQESIFIPFYSIVLERLIKINLKFKVLIQFQKAIEECFFQLLKTISRIKVEKIIKCCKIFSYLFVTNSISWVLLVELTSDHFEKNDQNMYESSAKRIFFKNLLLEILKYIRPKIFLNIFEKVVVKTKKDREILKYIMEELLDIPDLNSETNAGTKIEFKKQTKLHAT